MILKVFAVYDVKAVAYMQPFFSNSVGSALRAFGDASCEDRSPLSKHPADYNLFELGSFDDASGLLESLPAPKYLGSALDFADMSVKRCSSDKGDPALLPEDITPLESKMARSISRGS